MCHLYHLSNFFQFLMQFSTKTLSSNRLVPYPLWGWCPRLGIPGYATVFICENMIKEISFVVYTTYEQYVTAYSY